MTRHPRPSARATATGNGNGPACGQCERHGIPGHAAKPGMEVEVVGGDLGEGDVTPPRVAEVKRDRRGNLRTLMVRKGLISRRRLPCRRFASSRWSGHRHVHARWPRHAGGWGRHVPGKVTIDAGAREIDALGVGGKDRLGA